MLRGQRGVQFQVTPRDLQNLKGMPECGEGVDGENYSTGIPREYCRFGPSPLQYSECGNKVGCNLFAGGVSCFTFLKDPPSVKRKTVKHNETKSGCSLKSPTGDSDIIISLPSG